MRLVQTVESAGCRFMVHENWRWQPWYRETRAMMEDGTLGEVFSIYFRMRTGDGWRDDAYHSRQSYFRDYPRLLVFETGVHFIDTFRYLLGEIDTVYARLRRLNPVIRGEDAGHIVFGFRNGATAVLDANRYNESEDASTDPRYTFGTMRVDAAKAHVTLNTNGSLVVKPLGELAYEHPYRHENRGLGGDCCFHLQQHLVQSMLNGGQFESTGADYLRTVRVVEACYESAARGEVVLVTYDP